MAFIYLLVGVKPGVITDPERILSPCLLPDVSQRVEDMPLPADSEVREVFDEMIGGFGVPYGRLMAVIGGCMVCDQVMALPNITTHSCIGRTKNTGPCPSKRPLLPQHRRTLPTAGSRNAMELEMGQVALKADDDSDDGIECIGEIHSMSIFPLGTKTLVTSRRAGYTKNKRKKRISNPTSQHVLIHTKKPRVEEVSGRSQTTLASSKQMRAASAIPTGSHFRIPTPEGSREVYRPANGEFIMYKMA